MTTLGSTTQIATIGGGCFWCVEAVFSQLKGVISVQSGYAGGDQDTANYQSVCRGNSGHAEVVQITFNPLVISFRELLGRAGSSLKCSHIHLCFP